MKKVLKILSFIMISSFITSCSEVGKNSSPTNSASTVDSGSSNSSTVVDSGSQDTSSSTLDSEYTTLPDWDPIEMEVSIGGVGLDINVGRPLITGREYTGSITMSSDMPSDPEKETAISSNEKVLTVEKTSGGIKINALHAGQAYIRVFDSNEIIRYCALVEVKDAMKLSDVEDYLVYEADYWVGKTGGWGSKYIINFDEGYKITITGTEAGSELIPLVGTYQYDGLSETKEEYEYVINDVAFSNAGIVGFALAINGSFMYLHGKSMTLDILRPQKEA